MSSFPPGRFVREFSRRTHKNLQDIMNRQLVSYEDTALISSLLAVFVMPHERADDPTFLADLLAEYRQFPLEEIVKVLRVAPKRSAYSGTESLPNSVGEIPKFLRHAVAHMEIRRRRARTRGLSRTFSCGIKIPVEENYFRGEGGHSQVTWLGAARTGPTLET